MPLALVLCSLLTVAAHPPAPLSIDLTSTGGLRIAINGKLFSQSATTAFREGGRRCSTRDGTLKPVGAATPFAGTDRLGSFEGVRLAWACGAAAVPVETSVRVYGSLSSVTSATRGAAAAIFTQRWPRGAKGTAVGPPAFFSNVGDAGNAQEQVGSVFPAISVATAARWPQGGCGARATQPQPPCSTISCTATRWWGGHG